MPVDDARGELLRPVPADAVENTRMGAFLLRAHERGDVTELTYDALWAWSVEDLNAFWLAIVEFFDLQVEGVSVALPRREMPATWFPHTRVSYPEHALRHGGGVVGISQTRGRVEIGPAELREQVARCRAGLQRLGVGVGAAVAGYLPHVPETIVAFLATASLGAVWVSCPPEFGARAVIDRFSQVRPVVLIAVDGQRYGDKDIDRREQVAEIRAALPSVRELVSLPYLGPGLDNAVSWDSLLSENAPLEFRRVPFEHPLYVLFSSGTTGLPKAIVHGHGGIVVEHHKMLGLHNDVRAGDRFFWFSTTGWMMWNYAVSALLHGATVVCFDGNPAWPDLDTLWAMAADERLTYFGTSASFLMACRGAGVEPGRDHDLSALRGIGSTGSSLPAEGFRWVHEHVGDDVLLGSASGGTDICTALVGGSPLSPVRAGEISARTLGCGVAALDGDGAPVLGQPGELVVDTPMPSMPVALTRDPDRSRLRAAYFDQHPGRWTHGDWITIFDDGASVITGRSDSTLNRGGVRLGTSDFYSVVEEIVGVADSLVVHLEDPAGGMGELVLFVARDDSDVDDAQLYEEIRARLRGQLSPRHLPDEVVFLDALPRTLSGKKLEKPVKRILAGTPIDEVASRGSLTDPDALDAIVEWRDRGR